MVITRRTRNPLAFRGPWVRIPPAPPSKKALCLFRQRAFCLDGSPLRGSFFGSKVWNSTSKYHRVIWQCNNKFKGDHKCETPHLDEETIKARFVVAFNAVLDSKDNILEDCRLMQSALTSYTGVNEEIQSLLEEIDVVTELHRRKLTDGTEPSRIQSPVQWLCCAVRKGQNTGRGAAQYKERTASPSGCHWHIHI